MLGYPGTEQYRLRLGILLASSGTLLLLWAVGSWIVRDSVPAQAQAIVRSHGGEVIAPTTGGVSVVRNTHRDDRIEAARALPLLLLVVLAVVMTLLVGGFVIVRAMRRHRIYLGHQRPPPTDSSDVWSMHRVPDYDDDDPFGDDDRDDSGFGAGVS